MQDSDPDPYVKYMILMFTFLFIYTFTIAFVGISFFIIKFPQPWCDPLNFGRGSVRWSYMRLSHPRCFTVLTQGLCMQSKLSLEHYRTFSTFFSSRLQNESFAEL